MTIIIWGIGNMSCLIEEYIKHDVIIAAYVDNNAKNAGGGYVNAHERKTRIVSADEVKDIAFDFCVIAVKDSQTIVQQCLKDLKIPKEKILEIVKLTEWDIDLRNRIFNERIVDNSRNYVIEGVCIDLGEGHALPSYQKYFKMYDRFIPYLAKMTQEKTGKYIIDIGANVGDTLAAMLNHTDDNFLCIEPVGQFFNLLASNIQHFDNPNRIWLEQAFITDKMSETYEAIISNKGTAAKMPTDSNTTSRIPSKSVDYLLEERNITYEEVDLLKIDTDGFDADCIISASKLLEKGSAFIYWENYNETYDQYIKYLNAYRLLNENGYSVFFVFDNYGNYLCKGGIDVLNSILDYVQRAHTGCIGNTFKYFDVLTCKMNDVEKCERYITQYLDQYLLHRISW